MKKRAVTLPQLVRAGELAKGLGIAEVTLWRWRKKQIAMNDPIPVVEIGGEQRFDPEAVKDFIRTHTVPDTIKRRVS